MRFVLATLGTLGDLYPFLALGRALSARGHSVVIAGARAMHEHVEEAQLKAFPCRPNMSPEDVRAGFADFDHWPGDENKNARFERADLREFIRDRVSDLLEGCRGADALIHNSGVTGESVTAEILGIADIRVVIAAERQWNRRRGAFLSELETIPGGAGRPEAQRFFDWNQQCRKRAGLGESPVNGWHRYFAGTPLVAASRHFLAPIDTSSWDATICGFWLHDSPRWGDWTPDARLRAFMERRPMVLSLSSQPVPEPDRVVELHVETARCLGRPILVQAGWAGLEGSDGGDVLFRGFLPPDWTFSESACVISHGGAGTIARALRNARPLLIERWGNDQFFNAWMVVKGGLGAAVNPKKATPAELARIIDEKVLSGDVIRRAGDIAQQLAAEDGTALAVAAIENRMKSKGQGRWMT
jgi:UDP:flavonoid glycosyltransferase YjiC (YdhE family)